jgi:hypothetical protein
VVRRLDGDARLLRELLAEPVHQLLVKQVTALTAYAATELAGREALPIDRNTVVLDVGATSTTGFDGSTATRVFFVNSLPNQSINFSSNRSPPRPDSVPEAASALTAYAATELAGREALPIDRNTVVLDVGGTVVRRLDGDARLLRELLAEPVHQLLVKQVTSEALRPNSPAAKRSRSTATRSSSTSARLRPPPPSSPS